MRRLALVILIISLVLLLILISTVQIVLLTDFPRQFVLNQIASQTGLRVDAASLEPSWSGRTKLTDFSLALPLESEPFARVPMVSVRHTPLAQLLLGRSLKIESIVLHEPDIRLREREDGSWNVAHVIALIQSNSKQDDASEGLDLPDIMARGGALRVQPLANPDSTIQPIDISFNRSQSVAYEISMQLADILKVSGRMAARAPNPHEFSFELIDGEALAQLVMPETPSPIFAGGTWSGAITDGMARGRLHIASLRFADLEASGDLEIGQIESGVAIQPHKFSVRQSGDDANESRPIVTLESGLASIEGELIRLQKLRAAGSGVRATADGEWNRTTEAGLLTARWQGRIDADAVDHNGELRIQGRVSTADGVLLASTANAHVTTPAGSLDTRLSASIEGASLTNFATRLHAPSLIWTDLNGAIDLSGFALIGRTDWPRLALQSITLPGADTAIVGGSYDVQEQQWSIDLDIDDWQPPRVSIGPIDIQLVGNGDLDQFAFTTLRVDAPQFGEAVASGSYIFAADEPLTAQATLTARVLTDGPESDEVLSADKSEVTTLRTEVEMHGTVMPLALSYAGSFSASNVPVGAKRLNDVIMPWRGQVRPDRSTFTTDSFELLEGQWQIDGVYDNDARQAQVTINSTAVSVAQAIELLDIPFEMNGAFGAALVADIPMKDPANVEISGEWSVERFTAPSLAESRGSGRIDATRGDLQISEIKLEHEDGAIAGDINFNLNTRNSLELHLAASNWPVKLENTQLMTRNNVQADLSIDVLKQTAQGTADMTSTITVADQELGQVNVNAKVNGRTIVLNRIAGEIADGTIDGNATLSIDDLLTARANVAWQNVDLATLEQHIPGLSGASGASSGVLRIEEANDPRAPEPLRITVNANSAEGAWQGFSLGDVDIIAFAGPERIMVEHGSLGVADGRLELWGRLSRHDNERAFHSYIRLIDLDLNRVVQAVDPNASEVPGRVSGYLSVGGYASAQARLFGTGLLELTQSDLGSIPLFSLLYESLKLDFRQREPRGTGTIPLSLEGNALTITRMQYFNRGTEIGGTLTIEDIMKAGESPVNGLAVASVRPFHDLNLPLFGEADRLLTALQTDAAAVRISGTLKNYELQKVLLGDISAQFRRLLKASVTE